MSKRALISILLLVSVCVSSLAQVRPARQQPEEDDDYKPGVGLSYLDGDSITTVNMLPLRVFAKKKDFRRYQRTVDNVKKGYPYAKEAGKYMDQLAEELPKLKNDKERQKYTKKIEKEIVKTYTPVLENMTRTQGKILIKLIDRETSMTTYGILKEFRGGFSAGFWNTVAKLFKADLKATYDPKGEDKLIEEIIQFYEAGLL